MTHPLVSFDNLPEHHPLGANYSFRSTFWQRDAKKQRLCGPDELPAEVVLPPPTVLSNRYLEFFHILRCNPVVQQNPELMQAIKTWESTPNSQIRDFINLFISIGQQTALVASPTAAPSLTPPPPLSPVELPNSYLFREIVTVLAEDLGRSDFILQWRDETLHDFVEVSAQTPDGIYGYFSANFGPEGGRGYLASLVTFLCSFDRAAVLSNLTSQQWNPKNIRMGTLLRGEDGASPMICARVFDAPCWLGFIQEDAEKQDIGEVLAHLSETPMRQALGLHLLDLVHSGRLRGDAKFLLKVQRFFRAIYLLFLALRLVVPSADHLTSEQKKAQQDFFAGFKSIPSSAAVAFVPLSYDRVFECRVKVPDRKVALQPWLIFESLCRLCHGVAWASLTTILEMELQ